MTADSTIAINKTGIGADRAYKVIIFWTPLLNAKEVLPAVHVGIHIEMVEKTDFSHDYKDSYIL
jgi:hypothetical protein